MLSRHVFAAALFAATPATAYDFGFVRAPDWMDPIVGSLLAATVVLFGLTVAMKPRGVEVSEMYQHFGDFSLFGRIIYAAMALAFIALMGMVFLGMGLQRAAEAGV